MLHLSLEVFLSLAEAACIHVLPLHGTECPFWVSRETRSQVFLAKMFSLEPHRGSAKMRAASVRLRKASGGKGSVAPLGFGGWEGEQGLAGAIA